MINIKKVEQALEPINATASDISISGSLCKIKISDLDLNLFLALDSYYLMLTDLGSINIKYKRIGKKIDTQRIKSKNISLKGGCLVKYVSSYPDLLPAIKEFIQLWQEL